jgi:hypothetical protein
MKKFFFNTLAIVALVLVSVSIKAQPVVTEYFAMKEPFKIDLSDKKVQKAAYIKGVLDLDWNEAKHTLAVSYDPKLANAQDIVRHVKDVANGVITASNTPSGIAKNEKD